MKIVNKKSVIYICSRIPFPISGGREHMIVQSLKFISNKYSLKVICFKSPSQNPDFENFKRIGVKDVAFVDTVSFYQLAFNLIFRNAYSIQENLFCSKFNNEFIDRYITNNNPDLIICDMLRTAQFGFDKSLPLIVDFDDLLSERYRKMLIDSSSFSSLGTFAAKLPKWFGVVEKLLRKRVLDYELIRIKNAEKRAYCSADAVIFTSQLEADRANSTYEGKKAIGIPQAVAVLPKNELALDKNNALFLGNLTTAQNLASLKYIVEEILPHVNFRGDGMLLVAGKYDARALDIIRSTKSCVKLLGFVDSITELASSCKVALMPVAFGTGIKTKVLDAISLGLPVISNSIGLEGLDFKHEEHVLKSDDAVLLAKFVNVLFDDESLANSLKKSAEHYISTNHSYDVLSVRYSSCVNSVIK
jgi:polysaccharide biosynthesis protein PslH